jgi:hypothetical protein
VTNQDTPGTDWAARHAAAGQNANQPQHDSYTTPDGPVNTRQHHNHPMNDDWIINRLEQTT